VLVEVRDSGPGLTPEDSRAPFRGLLQDEAWRLGDGPVDLPFDHRSAWRPIVAERGPAPRRQLSIRPAGDRRHCVVIHQRRACRRSGSRRTLLPSARHIRVWVRLEMSARSFCAVVAAEAVQLGHRPKVPRLHGSHRYERRSRRVRVHLNGAVQKRFDRHRKLFREPLLQATAARTGARCRDCPGPCSEIKKGEAVI